MNYRHRVVALGLISLTVVCTQASAGDEEVRPPEQTLFIALDGVPYDLMAELVETGHFWNFADPSKVISPFPSISAVGFGGIMEPMGVDRPPGYDDEFYSYKENRIKGSLLEPHHVNHRSFQAQFDLYRYTTLSLIEMYTFPGMTGYNDLKTARNLIWDYPAQPYYMIYIGGTDGAGHVLGRKRLKHWLIFLDEYLQRLSRDYQEQFNRPLKIVLFSDHGFAFTRPNGISRGLLAKHLRAHNFYLKTQLENNRDVVSVVLGNVSAAPFYVAPQYVEELASVLIHFEGFDIVSYHNPVRITVLANRHGSIERAEITWRDGGRFFKYQPITGDPLYYKDVIKELRNKGLMDRKGYATSRAWFEATTELYYPDALFRLYHAFHGLVENTAPILISTSPDYEIGDTWTRIGTWLRGGLEGTHGGLFDITSEAFVMTNNPDIKLPSRMRYNEWMSYFFPNGMDGGITVTSHSPTEPSHSPVGQKDAGTAPAGPD